MATYRWRVEFSLPGVPIARPVALDTIQLTPSPRDEKGHSRSTGYLLLETDQYLQQADAEQRALAQLETVAVAAAALGGSVREPVVISVRLENQDELEAAGVRTPLLDAGLRFTWNVIAPDIEEILLARAHRAALALGEPEASLWGRAARWLWKANSDANPYDQFLALWISFNVMYGPHATNGEPRAIRDFFAQAIASEPAAEALLVNIRPEDLRLLAGSGLTLRRGKRRPPRPIANELQAALELPAVQQSRRELIELALLVIYAVRCAVIHEGGVMLPRDQEIRLVWASAHVLKPALMWLLRSRLGV